jgi:hypothetical protein
VFSHSNDETRHNTNLPGPTLDTESERDEQKQQVSGNSSLIGDGYATPSIQKIPGVPE